MRWLPFRIYPGLGFAGSGIPGREILGPRTLAWGVVAGFSLLVTGLLLTCLGGRPALAQIDSREGIALQNQVYQLRQEVQQLRDQLSRGGGGGGYSAPPPSYRAAPSGDIATQLLTRVDALEERVRELRGQMDQTQHAQQQMAADLSKRIDDLSFQQRPQGGGGFGGPGLGGGSPGGPGPVAPTYGYAPSPAGPSAGSPSPAPAPAGPVRRTPEIALQEGNAALARRDYTAAETAAREVLNARTSPRAYDAQFLLAQALAGQRQYAQSAIAYDDAYNRSRKGTHAPDALVGLASTLTSLNEKKAACDTLTKLAAEFPQARQDLRDDASNIRQRAGCR